MLPRNLCLISMGMEKKYDLVDSTTIDPWVNKDQLISKCPFSVIVWTKIPTKNVFNTLNSPYNHI